MCYQVQRAQAQGRTPRFPPEVFVFLMLTSNLLQHTCRFLIYKINDKNTEIGLETTGEKDATYAHFLTLLPENDCRYCVYDFE